MTTLRHARAVAVRRARAGCIGAGNLRPRRSRNVRPARWRNDRLAVCTRLSLRRGAQVGRQLGHCPRCCQGRYVAEGGLSADDAFTQIVELPAVPPGAYQAHWISITADDNGKTQGDVNFTVVAATPSPAVTPTPSDEPNLCTAVGKCHSYSRRDTALTATPPPTASAAPGETGQPAGSELILPIVLVGAIVVVAWPGSCSAGGRVERPARPPARPGRRSVRPRWHARRHGRDAHRGWLRTFSEIGIEADRDHVARLIGADGKRLAIEVAGVAGRELTPERAEADRPARRRRLLRR